MADEYPSPMQPPPGWDGKWGNSVAEAVARMREHLAKDGCGQSKPVKFDARDRLALEFLLERVAARDLIYPVVASYNGDCEIMVDGVYATVALAKLAAERSNEEKDDGPTWEAQCWRVRTDLPKPGEDSED